MRIAQLRVSVATLALAAGVVVPAALADNPVSPIDGGTVAAQCYAHGSSSSDDSGYKFCRSVQQLTDVAAAACRAPLRSAPNASTPEYCGVFDGREVSEEKVRAYESSWVHQALTMQRALDDAAPLREEQIPHTHNSFNASAYYLPSNGSRPSYYPTLTNQDPNQVYSITDQLRMDVRALEIDLHWVPSPYGSAATKGYWVTMCHGDSTDETGHNIRPHVGCTDDRPLQDGLAEVRAWLDANPHEVLLIYLENQLVGGMPGADVRQAHNITAAIIKSALGGLVYQPPQDLSDGDCAPMPYDASRADIRASGARVLLVGNCGPGQWNRWVFTRGPQWDESGDPTSYGSSNCSADQQAMESHTAFRRWYEESPWLEAMTGGTQVLTAQTTAAMTRCGVNIIGFDQLQPFDGRLAALVWSWAQGEPAASAGGCAYQGTDRRFHASSCGVARHFACVAANGYDFTVTRATGDWADGQRVCATEFPGSRFGVPPNGYRNAQIGWAAARLGSAATVWLDYAQVHGQWTPWAQADAGASGDGDGPPHGHAYGRHKHRH